MRMVASETGGVGVDVEGVCFKDPQDAACGSLEFRGIPEDRERRERVHESERRQRRRGEAASAAAQAP